MPPQPPRDAERWTEYLPDEFILPRGPKRAAKSAISALGPFVHKLHKGVDFDPPWKFPFEGSEELAAHQVEDLAMGFNQAEYLARNAPRQKDVIEKLKTLEEMAGQLAGHFTSLDDITLGVLRRGGSDFFQTDPRVLAAFPDHNGPGEWVEALRALSLSVNATLALYLRSKGIDDIDKVDKGGATNLYTDYHGVPRRSLAQRGWQTYDLFKPDTATGTEGGPFHRFLMDVFEYATGLRPEENAKLTNSLKFVTKINRSFKAAEARERILKDELLDLVEQRLSGAEAMAQDERAAELRGQLRVAGRERDQLWDKMYSRAIRKQAGSKPPGKS